MLNITFGHLVPRRRVVDAFTRTLHALLAISFGLAYVSSEIDALRIVHVTMGYTLGAVFLLRVLWGIVGPRRVRLSALFARLAGLRQMPELLKRIAWQEILKRLLALSMVSVILCALPVLASGYLTYFEVFGNWTEEVHEFLANVMVLAVSCHVASVVILGWGRSGQQIRPMITGYVKGQGPDLAKHNLTALAVTLMLTVVGFWSWQTYQYLADPQFTQQPQWLHPIGGYADRGDD